VRFVCSTFGSSGDVFPMLGLALALRDRGHEVTFATNEHYAGVARRQGVAFEALGTEAEFAATVNDPDLWRPRRAFRHIFQCIRPALRRQYDVHVERAASGPVVGITNCFGFGAFVARDRLGIPVLTLHCQPAVIWSDARPPTLPGVVGPRWLKGLIYRTAERFVIDPIVCPSLNAWRAELGLPPVGKILRWWNSPDGVVCLFPEWYAPPQPDWPANPIQTDFPLWNDRSEEGMPAEVANFLDAGDPPLVFTPGSANLHGRDFFAAAGDACRRLGRRGVLLSEFPEQIPAGLPGSVAYFRYVPLDLLLPRAAAFVHHGGIGSTSQALAAGIPQLIMPLAHDQPDNAARVARLGVGDSLKPRRFTGARLARRLGALLSSQKVAFACREAAKKLDAHDGLARAAAAVESRVARR
jgi:rhamnosyltransferase subunit B